MSSASLDGLQMILARHEKAKEKLESHWSCRTYRVGAVTHRQSIVSLVLRALHWIAHMQLSQNNEPQRDNCKGKM